MNYKKIVNDEYDIHIIKTKDFHTIDMRIFMTEDVSKEKITYRNALVDILTYATNKYRTKQELIKKCEDLYSLRPTASVSRNGNLQMPKDNYKSYKNIGKALEEVAQGLLTIKK